MLKKSPKLHLLFIAFLGMLSAVAQQTAIPDQNFEQALIDLGHDDVIDGQVITSNISGITTLNVSEKGISDLTGIEDFTALTKLFCRVNTISHLDLSNNTVLKQLNCSDNEGLTALDVSNNLVLEILFCENNNLSTLDVSKNTLLNDLVCYGNQLTDLDVSNNPALKHFNCTYNALTSLNVKNGNNGILQLSYFHHNPDLVCIEVDNVAFSNAEWSKDKDDTAIFSEDCSLKPINYNQIIVGANNNHATFSANLDGSNPSEMLIPSFSFNRGVDSPSESKIYASWYYGIVVMDYDGNNLQTLYDYYPKGGLDAAVDIDFNNNDVYFISTLEDKLYKMKTDGSGLTVISSTIGHGSDLVLDTNNNHIYYSENIVSASKGLYRMNMDGTGLETLIPNTDIDNFEIDFVRSKIYYASNGLGYVCNLDGSNITELFNFRIGGIAIDNKTNLLYITDDTNHSVKTANLDGSNIQTIIESTDISFFDGGYQALMPLEFPSGIVLINNNKLAVKDVKSTTKVFLYPNPSKRFIQLSGVTKTQNYTIYNIFGTQIKKGIISNQENIDIQHLAKGVYVLKLEDGNTLKFIKD